MLKHCYIYIYIFFFFFFYTKLIFFPVTLATSYKVSIVRLGLGDMAKKIITIIFFISVDIDNYHDKCQIFISFKFKDRILLQNESFRNQTIHFP